MLRVRALLIYIEVQRQGVTALQATPPARFTRHWGVPFPRATSDAPRIAQIAQMAPALWRLRMLDGPGRVPLLPCRCASVWVYVFLYV